MKVINFLYLFLICCILPCQAQEDSCYTKFGPLAKAGDVDSQYDLGQCYEKNGSIEKACKWYKIAANQYGEAIVAHKRLCEEKCNDIVIPKAGSRRYALLIGNEKYHEKNTGLSQLSCPVNDAKALKERLSNLGFVAIYEENLNSANMQKKLDKFKEKQHRYDVILFYFSGHGGYKVDSITGKITNYIYMTDGRGFIVDSLKLGNENQTKIIILDACRTQAKDTKGQKGFSPILLSPNTIIAYSTSPERTSIDCGKKGRNSPYIETLLEYIDKCMPIETLFKKVRIEMEKDSLNTPWESSSLSTDFYFNEP